MTENYRIYHKVLLTNPKGPMTGNLYQTHVYLNNRDYGYYQQDSKRFNAWIFPILDQDYGQWLTEVHRSGQYGRLTQGLPVTLKQREKIGDIYLVNPHKLL